MRRGRIGNAERGIAIPVVVICMVVIAAALSFAIDLPRKELTVHELRSALDAAVLGGATKIDGSPEGLASAIHVVDQQMRRASVGNRNLRTDEYKVEFGFFSFAENKFEPLLNAETYRNPDIPLDVYNDVPAAAMINSIRVTAAVDSPSIFSKIIGFGSTGEVTQKSYAVANRSSKVCGFPIAIPLCSLYLSQNPDQDPREGAKYSTDKYYPRAQCGRTLYVSEADVRSLDGLGDAGDPHHRMRSDLRLGGLNRATAYQSLPQVPYSSGNNLCGINPKSDGELDPNCLATFNVHGTFVLPDDPHFDLNANKFAESREVLSLVDRLVSGKEETGGRACINFEIGQHVIPMDYADRDDPMTPRDADRPLFDQGDDAFAAERIFHDLIFASPFSKRFSDTIAKAENAPGYPFLRTTTVDPFIGYGNTVSVSKVPGADRYTNPMCHFGGHTLASGQRVDALPADDPASARAAELIVPLIMPGAEQAAFGQRYCDHAATIGEENPQFPVPPISLTNPRVVGFTKIYLYDFNLQRLEDSAEKPDIPAAGLPQGRYENQP